MNPEHSGGLEEFHLQDANRTHSGTSRALWSRRDTVFCVGLIFIALAGVGLLNLAVAADTAAPSCRAGFHCVEVLLWSADTGTHDRQTVSHLPAGAGPGTPPPPQIPPALPPPPSGELVVEISETQLARAIPLGSLVTGPGDIVVEFEADIPAEQWPDKQAQLLALAPSPTSQEFDSPCGINFGARRQIRLAGGLAPRDGYPHGFRAKDAGKRIRAGQAAKIAGRLTLLGQAGGPPTCRLEYSINGARKRPLQVRSVVNATAEHLVIGYPKGRNGVHFGDCKRGLPKTFENCAWVPARGATVRLP